MEWKQYSQAGNSNGGDGWLTSKRMSYPKDFQLRLLNYAFSESFQQESYPVMYI